MRQINTLLHRKPYLKTGDLHRWRSPEGQTGFKAFGIGRRSEPITSVEGSLYKGCSIASATKRLIMFVQCATCENVLIEADFGRISTTEVYIMNCTQCRSSPFNRDEYYWLERINDLARWDGTLRMARLQFYEGRKVAAVPKTDCLPPLPGTQIYGFEIASLAHGICFVDLDEVYDFLEIGRAHV